MVEQRQIGYIHQETSHKERRWAMSYRGPENRTVIARGKHRTQLEPYSGRVTEGGRILAEGEERRRQEFIATYRLAPDTSWKTISIIRTELWRQTLVERLGVDENTTLRDAIGISAQRRHAKRAAKVGLPPSADPMEIARREPDWEESIRMCT